MAGLRLVAKFLTEKDAKTRQMLQSQFEHGGAYYTACDEFPRIDSDVTVRDGERRWLLGARGHLHRKATLSAVQRGWSSARSTRWARDRFT